MSRTTSHPAIIRARYEGFLRTKTYRVNSSIHVRWWQECHEADQTFIQVIEKPSCSRLIIDTHSRRSVALMAPRFVDEVEAWAERAYTGGASVLKAIIGDTAIDIDGLDRGEAAEMASDIARCLTYSINWADSWPQEVTHSRNGKGGLRPIAHLAQRKADAPNERERRVQ